MTATRVQVWSRAWSSTCSGRLVSTTTSSVRLSACSMASCGVMKAFLYSGSCLSRSISSAEEFFTGSMTMRQGLPFLRAMQHTATAEPTASRSANLCPMAKTREESAISSARALAITRLLTFVRVSTSLPRPPKNSKLKRFFTTAWSPPRERAISTARELNWKSLPEAAAVHAQADADGGVDAAGADDLVHALQQRELVRPHLVQVAGFKDEEVAVAVIAAQHGVLALRELGDAVLHRVAQLVFSRGRAGFLSSRRSCR